MDIKELAERLGLDETEYLELLGLFVTTGHSDLKKLQAAVQATDSEGAVQAAHSIKGAAGNLGLMDFYTRAKQVEDDARNGILERVGESILLLKENLAEIEAMVKAGETA
jgi:HPt (histidine-containing phosphotransfer) domain-containing protein